MTMQHTNTNEAAVNSHPDAETILEVNNLRVAFRTDEGLVQAVDSVDFTVRRGQTLGIVGESGSGKSVSTKALMRLLPPNAVIAPESQIILHKTDGPPVDITQLKSTGREIRSIRGNEIAMIFQEPMASFSPVYTIGNQITEAIRAHRKVSRKEAREIGVDMLARVGLSNPAQRFDQYPFELSGGMRQRAMIATALSTNPSLLIADEPTTALDVTIQAQILRLMADLQDEFNMAIIFISHDLGVISKVADDIAVMYLGRVIEHGTTRDLIASPRHPYTQALLNAIPRIETLHARLQPVGGDIPGPMSRPPGCAFHTRCPQAIAGRCNVDQPPAYHINKTHTVSCFLYEDWPGGDA
jgi:peptide/nickel transport system ATP-binding protein